MLNRHQHILALCDNRFECLEFLGRFEYFTVFGKLPNIRLCFIHSQTDIVIFCLELLK
jgi:hypothetical protein